MALGICVESEESQDADTVADTSVSCHVDGFAYRESEDFDLLSVFWLCFSMSEACGNKDVAEFVAGGVGELDAREQRLKVPSDDARLFQKLAACGIARCFARRAAALGNLPLVAFMAVAPLSDKPGVAFAIDRDDANSAVLVFDDAIDALAPARLDDLILTYSNPRIRVGLA